MESKKKIIVEEGLVPLFLGLFYLLSFFLMMLRKESFPHYMQSLSSLALTSVPFFLYAIFHFRTSFLIKVLYYLFVFIGMYLANACNLYQLLPFWDKILHFLSGPFAFILGIYLLCLLKKEENLNVIEVLLFALIFTLASGGLWEIIEYTTDIIFASDAQKYIDTGVSDTMTDMIAMLSGGTLTFAAFGIITSIVKDNVFMKGLYHLLNQYREYNACPYKERKLFSSLQSHN